jgi:hypothetical protein
MRTPSQRMEDRRRGVDPDEHLLELCRTIDDAAERIVEALDKVADTLNALELQMRRGFNP